MEKKTETKKKEETIVEETNKTIVTDKKSEDKKPEIKKETYEELFYKEKIVRLLCAKYENGANIELSYKNKYDFFNKVYNNLIDKIEKKVTDEYNEKNR